MPFSDDRAVNTRPIKRAPYSIQTELLLIGAQTELNDAAVVLGDQALEFHVIAGPDPAMLRQQTPWLAALEARLAAGLHGLL
jgi:hypothetical protein